MSETQKSKTPFFKRKLFWLAIVYISLLVWSGIYRYNSPKKSLAENKKTVQLNAIANDRKLDSNVVFAYKEILPKVQNDSLPVVLIHGSPGSAEVFDGLSKLIKDRRLIAVDLPGFGDSEQDIPDYSIYTHANYLAQFLDKLDLEKAHFVGFSLGGGVVLNLETIAPNRIESVSFIASIGVQEYELFGDYYANHFIHGVQLAFCGVLQELTPHFGIFDGVPMAYSRNFYDTDQRPLRNILQKIDKPFQIIHGKNDPLVPVEAAREHSRIIPQSEYIELDENHFFIFKRPEKISELLRTFWDKVEHQTAKTRTNADEERIIEANKPFEYKVLEAKGATVFVFFLLLSIIAFFNEDFAFLLAGIFIAQGRLAITFALIACLFGIVISILFWLLLGRFRGENLSIFESFSSKNIFTERIGGFRFPIYFDLGKSSANFWTIAFKLILLGIVWSILLILVSCLITNLLVLTSLFSIQNTIVLIITLTIISLLLNYSIRCCIRR